MIGLGGDITLGGYLVDTLIWTAALIALVLAARRPVARAFGAPMAYALWLLPMARLVLPPIALPGWLAAPVPAPGAVPVAGAQTVRLIVETPVAAPPGASAVSPGPDWLSALAALPLAELALALWLGGAGVFLYRRFAAYFALRVELLEGARTVGSTPGPWRTIRLIETPGTAAPLAFGVLDPVIALPPGFMARIDRAARDLALAHEIEHHRGHDLLINILVQPLFALHWFNPLGHYGWLALRRDQEAACDARVLAAAPRDARALYASVIASFAAGPDVALAAPMACPVLGDKSIIQRLRNIKMTEHSSDTAPRRMLARLMLGTALLALPLTASISYARSDAPAARASAPPAAPSAAMAQASAVPDAPEPPAPPASPDGPDAPDAPDAPEPPQPPERIEATILTIDPDTGAVETIDRTGPADAPTASAPAAGERRQHRTVTREVDESRQDGAKQRYETVTITNRGKNLEEAELEIVMKDLREGLADADKAMKEVRVELQALEKDENWTALVGDQPRTVVRMSCQSDSDEVATTTTREDGRTEVMICQSRIMAHALKGLKEARKAIAGSTTMDAGMRRQILAELDQQIASWKNDAR